MKIRVQCKDSFWDNFITDITGVGKDKLGSFYMKTAIGHDFTGTRGLVKLEYYCYNKWNNIDLDRPDKEIFEEIMQLYTKIIL